MVETLGDNNVENVLKNKFEDIAHIIPDARGLKNVFNKFILIFVFLHKNDIEQMNINT